MTTKQKHPRSDEGLTFGSFTRIRYRNLTFVALAAIAVVGVSLVVVNDLEARAPGLSDASTYSQGAESIDSIESRSGELMSSPQDSRSNIVTGSLGLTVESPSDVSNEIVRVVEISGGRIDSLSKQPGNEYQPDSASLTVRIPSSNYTSTLSKLEALGQVTYSNVNLYDVQEQVNQNDIRTESLRKSIDRLQNLLSNAQTTTDLVQIESELQNREAELEILISSNSSLTDQVDYATLQVTLTSEEESVRPEPETFASGFISGWESLVGFGAAILVSVGVMLPWALILGALGSVVYLVLRVLKKRQDSKK